MKELKCSNCGWLNEYSNKEINKVFPYSRERLICKNCKHTLSVNSYFVEGNLKSKLIFWIIFIVLMLGIGGLIFYAGFF